jgi:hypothetical protein
MYRKPWFQILEVIEPRGRSMADIVNEVVKRRKVSLREVLGARQHEYLLEARREIYEAIRAERPDLSSNQVGKFMNRDGSRIRHFWRNQSEAAA